MLKLIKFFTLVLCFAFNQNILASDGYCERCSSKNEESIKIDTIYKDITNSAFPCTGKSDSIDTVINKEPIIAKLCQYGEGRFSVDTIIYINKRIKTTKLIKTDSTTDFITTISDIKGNVLEFRHEAWKNHDVIRLVYDDVTRDIVHKTPCDFAVIEHFTDTIFFHLDSKKKFLDFIGNQSVLVRSKISPKLKSFIDTSSVYSKIISRKYSGCNSYYEMNESQRKKGNRK